MSDNKFNPKYDKNQQQKQQGGLNRPMQTPPGQSKDKTGGAFQKPLPKDIPQKK